MNFLTQQSPMQKGHVFWQWRVMSLVPNSFLVPSDHMQQIQPLDIKTLQSLNLL